MGKNIVLCADGTGQIDDGDCPSNVARLCSLLRLEDPERQICCYDPGVGTMPGRQVVALTTRVHSPEDLRNLGGTRWIPRSVKKIAGAATGYGLQKNIEDLYGYLAKNYAGGDSVYLFGFSRGAFTVRVVAGLLSRCGLLLPDKLNYFQEAFDLYKPHFETYKNEPGKLLALKQRIATFKAEHATADAPTVHFLGVWDTVKSYGYFSPRSLPHTRHNPIVKTVRHALSIGEHRSFYALTSWGGRDLEEEEEGGLPQDELPQSRDVKEVWFAGDHSDVGGGHCEDIGLAMISLKWMVNEAASSGLRADECRYNQMLNDLSQYKCRAHDLSAKWYWRALELLPRKDLKNWPLPPTREWTWKSTGPRKISESRRNANILIHESAQEFYIDEKREHLWGRLNPEFIQTAQEIS